ncbi:hypothetical protein Vretifemale_18702 [Volvox reticuliferus]|uniref:HotDog ACOT-type domain-containing protein n=1 Tax=Volvox reticuliferus TaxID=1737510 RepID=A0A8J4CXL2_9CHLO|nr:hypothetical protein Vretifemale_18702 [Volvox reticuliferus]
MMITTLRLEEPEALKDASLDEARWCLPFSYEVGEHRRGGRGLLIRFKPRPDDPADLSGPGPLDWALKARYERTGASLASAAARAAMASTPITSAPDMSRSNDPAASSASTSHPRGTTKSADIESPSSSERAPSDSHLELIFPFSNNSTLREQYQRFTSNQMRFGLLLEDLDTLAGDIAARHAGVSDRVLLTASIDRISWLQDPNVGEVSLANNLRMAGQVVWAGRSSMEVMIELSHQAPGSPPDEWRFIGLAFFVLVARTLDRTAAAEVPALVPETQREKELFEQGKVHMQQRQQRRDSHWARRPPTSHEVALVHDLIRQHHLHRVTSHHHHHLHHQHQEAVAMHRTVLQNCCLMHSQDRNVFDVIFGGHLLRLAYEHAYSTAALHAGEYCDPISMDDVAFLMPVPIGTLLRLTGQVVYAEGPVVRVHVRAAKLEPGAPEQSVVTNVFSFAFRCPSGPVRRVIPETMVEAMEYVTGHRQNANDEASQAVLAAQAVARL